MEVSRTSTEPLNRYQRAVAWLPVRDEMHLIDAARSASWRVHDPVTRLIRRFNERGLAALDDQPWSGHPRASGAYASSKNFSGNLPVKKGYSERASEIHDDGIDRESRYSMRISGIIS